MSPMCGDMIENCLHAFCDFPWTRPILYASGFHAASLFTQWSSCGEWLQFLLNVLTIEEFWLLLVLLYQIWHRRNLVVHENRMTHGWQVTASSRALLASYDSSKGFTNSNRTSSAALKNNWCKPPDAAIKINVDAACSRSSGRSTISVLARDHHGLVVACHASPLAGPCDVGLVEAAAVTLGIRMAIDLQFSEITIECDAVNVVLRLTLTQLDLSVVGFKLVEARRLLQDNPHIFVRGI
ncbi:hypothetical protein F3Y22_tig00112528pilonHSYRG00026 [Hibiscus syriacus]|uniref:RNase H type-1 domain-containing protein n=1 Tax=Hibiscus syriacus TaxID=106335 RepID=A0A6A2WWF0_HIBSY|nr:hypothetical protein F3Y22_tig00112528pilonHSYRG00026 [Hibiscus syriacus]